TEFLEGWTVKRQWKMVFFQLILQVSLRIKHPIQMLLLHPNLTMILHQLTRKMIPLTMNPSPNLLTILKQLPKNQTPNIGIDNDDLLTKGRVLCSETNQVKGPTHASNKGPAGITTSDNSKNQLPDKN